jgi:hypothetical protein
MIDDALEANQFCGGATSPDDLKGHKASGLNPSAGVTGTDTLKRRSLVALTLSS